MIRYKLLLVLTIIVLNGISGKCSGMSDTIIVVNNSNTESQWLYSTSVPDYGWHSPDYQVHNWHRGVSPFVSDNKANSINGTEWKVTSICMRKEFYFPQLDDTGYDMYLNVLHNYYCDIYINGMLAAIISGIDSLYTLCKVNPRATKSLKRKQNIISANTHTLDSSRIIDPGLFTVRKNYISNHTGIVTSYSVDFGKQWQVKKALEWYRK